MELPLERKLSEFAFKLQIKIISAHVKMRFSRLVTQFLFISAQENE